MGDAFRHGSRVSYAKDKIPDVPKGTLGTVVGDEHGREIIVRFDGIPHNRYLWRRDLRLEGESNG